MIERMRFYIRFYNAVGSHTFPVNAGFAMTNLDSCFRRNDRGGMIEVRYGVADGEDFQLWSAVVLKTFKRLATACALMVFN